MTFIRLFALMLSLVTASLAPQALACELAGPNAHVGIVTALDQKSLILKDAGSGMDLTFVATPEQLKGVAVKDTVTVVFSPEGGKLVARSVKKG